MLSLGLKEGDLVFGHSNIGFFGRPRGAENTEQVCAGLLNAFLKILGPSGTLVLPAYTYSFAQGKEFDPTTTPSTCGAFSSYLLKHPKAVRSCDPNVSVVAIGGKALKMTENPTENSYSPEGFFGRLLRHRGYIFSLNFQAASTFVHYIERELRVPYRFDKTFIGYLRDGKLLKRQSSTIWVRHLGSELTRTNLAAFEDLANSSETYQLASVGRGKIGLLSAADNYNILEAKLKENPWFLTDVNPENPPTLSPEQDLVDWTAAT